jgi:hypothetical protein
MKNEKLNANACLLMYHQKLKDVRVFRFHDFFGFHKSVDFIGRYESENVENLG